MDTNSAYLGAFRGMESKSNECWQDVDYSDNSSYRTRKQSDWDIDNDEELFDLREAAIYDNWENTKREFNELANNLNIALKRYPYEMWRVLSGSTGPNNRNSRRLIFELDALYESYSSIYNELEKCNHWLDEIFKLFCSMKLNICTPNRKEALFDDESKPSGMTLHKVQINDGISDVDEPKFKTPKADTVSLDSLRKKESETYETGDIVIHREFGKGTVKNIFHNLSGDVIEIDFIDSGIKKLSLKVASSYLSKYEENDIIEAVQPCSIHLHGVDGSSITIRNDDLQSNPSPQFEEKVVDGHVIYVKQGEVNPEAEEEYYNDMMGSLDSLIDELDKTILNLETSLGKVESEKNKESEKEIARILADMLDREKTYNQSKKKAESESNYKCFDDDDGELPF